MGRVVWRVARTPPGHADAVFDSGFPTIPTWTEIGDLTPTGWELGPGSAEFTYVGATGTVAFDMDITFTFPAGASGNGWWTITAPSGTLTGPVTPSAPGVVHFHCAGSLSVTNGDVIAVGLAGSFAQQPTAVGGVFP